MALGTKRICQSCGLKFYDLDKDPIKCPKCQAVFNPGAMVKPKRGRRKAVAAVEAAPAEEIEVAIDDEVIEELDDDAAIEELDEEIREEMEVGDEDGNPVPKDKDEDKMLVDLEDETDDLNENSDEPPEKE